MSGKRKQESPQERLSHKSAKIDDAIGASSDSKDFHFSDKPTLEDLRQEIVQFSKERNWDQYHQPRNLLLAMMGEVGEVAELFQWKGEVKEGLPDWSDEEKVHLGQELSDVLNYLVRLADKCHIDLPLAATEKIKLNAKKYPAKLVYGKSEKYDKYEQSSEESR